MDRLRVFSILLITVSGLFRVEALVYERCELVNEFRRRGFPEHQLADWVCLAYQESRYDTAAEGRLNWDGSVDHGLFQISDLYWCSWSSRDPSRTYKNLCGANCDDFHDEDISDDMACVKKIFDEHQRIQGNGFMAWMAWKSKCQGIDMSSYVSGCEKSSSSSSSSSGFRPRPPTVSYSGDKTSAHSSKHSSSANRLTHSSHDKSRLVPYKLGSWKRSGSVSTATTRKPWRPAATTRKPWRPAATTRKPWRPAATTRKPWRPAATTRGPWRSPWSAGSRTANAGRRPQNVFLKNAKGNNARSRSTSAARGRNHPFTNNVFLKSSNHF